MIPGPLTLNLYRGDTYRSKIQLWMDKGQTQPFDLTGVQAAAQIRTLPKGSIITDLSCTIELPNSINLQLDPSDSNFTIRKAYWDLELIMPNGDVQTVLAGSVNLRMDVTNSTGGE